MTGADVVEVGSILMIKGMKWLPQIIDRLDQFMDEHGYPTVESIRGIATERSVRDYGDQFRQKRLHAVVNQDTCQNPTCNICVQMCFYEALSQNPAGKIDVHPESCIGCELCLDVCPFDSISMNETKDLQFDEGYFRISDGIYEPAAKFTTRRNNMETITSDSPRLAAE